ncbi:hypothetical protein V6N13_040231 [Hibiscus sabdariffa]|uniref:Uncharacterized protein n=2 Tax=Hibiscus sabdariffa TaxID=183260 RepID=A0ABR1ZP13_9ROSI
MSFQKERNDKLNDVCIPDELVVSNVRTRDIDLKNLGQYTSENSKEAECLVPVDEDDRTNAPTDLQQEHVVFIILLGISSLTIIDSISKSLFL